MAERPRLRLTEWFGVVTEGWSRRAIIPLSTPRRYGIAILATLAGMMLRWALSPLWGSYQLPFITFFPAVMVSAWLGGFGPGLTTTLLSTVIADFLWIEPRYSFAIHQLGDGAALGIYTLMGAVISLLNELWRRAAFHTAHSEQRLRTTLDSIGDAVITTDAQGRVTHLNRSAQELTGWDAADAIGRPISDVFVIVNEDSRRPAEDPLTRVLHEGLVKGLGNHTLLVARDGRNIPIEDSAAAIIGQTGGIEGVVVVFRDITERRRAWRERATRLNDRHTIVLTNAERLARMGSWRWELATNTLTWSAELYRIYGINPGTPLTFASFLEHLHPNDRERVRGTVETALQRREPFRFTERIIRPDGEMRTLDSQGDVELEGAAVVALFGFCRDITEERRAEEALREREDRFARMFQASPVASVLTEAKTGRLLDVNARFLEITGFTRDELVGRTTEDVWLWNRGEREALLRKLRDRGSLREVHLDYRTRAGQRCQALASIEQLTVNGQECLLKLFLRT